MKNKKTDWNLVAVLLSIAALGILVCGMAKWIDEQSRRIDTLELEVISLQGSKPKRSKVIWHGNTY